MTRSFHAEAVIRRSQQDVWDGLTDWKRAPEWMNGVEGLSVDGDSREAAVLTFTARGKERTSTITVWRPPDHLQLVSEHNGVQATYDYTLDDVTSGVTHLALEAYCEASGALRAIEPVIRLVMKLADRGQPGALKELLDP